MTWIRFRDGQMVEGCDCWNLAGLLEALRSGRASPSVTLS
jgi:hypothetical protein